MSSATRTILHVDMDAFYASVEQHDNPELRGKPLVVGGGSNRGVVAAASYEVREFGVRSAMPMREALRRCPDLIQVTPRMSRYKEVSAEIFNVFQEFTPLVEGLSLDEAFLDVTASRTLHGAGVDIARRIKTKRNFEEFNRFYNDPWFELVTDSYHDQWWGYTGVNAVAGLGIHGQFIYINSDADVVIAKHSSDPDAESERVDSETPFVIHAIADFLSEQSR